MERESIIYVLQKTADIKKRKKIKKRSLKLSTDVIRKAEENMRKTNAIITIISDKRLWKQENGERFQNSKDQEHARIPLKNKKENDNSSKYK